jgi:hypothetical protein
MRNNRQSDEFGRRIFLGGASALAAFAHAPVLNAAIGPDAEPKEILIIGDSMIAGGFGLFLERELKKTHGFATRRRGKSSSGLARPDFFDWMQEARNLVAERQPDASVVMFGGNDVQGLYHTASMRKSGAPKWLVWHDEKWPEEYARRINELCDILAPDGQQIFWVGLPTMRPDNFRKKVERVNTIYRAEMAIRSDATFIDTWQVLADDDGNYADSICLEPAAEGKSCKKVRVRAGDGIHISVAGAHHLKAFVLDTMVPALGNA